MHQKQLLGQFFTTNYKYIMDGMDQPEVKHIVEPFAGNRDMLKFLHTKVYTQRVNAPKVYTRRANSHKVYNIACYDIDPKDHSIQQRDTLMDPLDYTDLFVITNPPFLARNKSSDKTIFDKYGHNDLYKCFVQTLLNNPPVGGIIILPINFWSSIRKADVSLRKAFVDMFVVERVNVFEERVFDDTSCTICCIRFNRRVLSIETNNIEFIFYPTKTKYSFEINASTNYTIGGDIYTLTQSPNIEVERLTSKNVSTKEEGITNLYLRAIDNNPHDLIRIEYSDAMFVDRTPRLSERSFATLVITPPIDKARQLILVKRFNDFMYSERSRYHSMFLTNFRESKEGEARKRISFNLAYSIVNYLLQA
jgi:hypothetical protein